MRAPAYLGIPPYNGVNVRDWAIYVRNVVNGCLEGKTNNTGSVTLSTSTSSTTVVLARGRLGPNTVILFQPTTSNAAIEVSTATMWVSTMDSLNNKFVLTNAINNQNDRTFNFVLIG
jgi:hypothetical protein